MSHKKVEREGGSPAGDPERFQALASLLSAVAHPVRLLILEHLLGGVRCVKDLNDVIPVSQPNLSQHMAALRDAGLVDCQSSGPLRCYYVIRPSLVRTLLASDPQGYPARPRSRASVLAELRRFTAKEVR
ncbi:MAG: winged helix-turn-helix transcriptional regulator [Planctomycetes bacterium]|nr:winged helix-turn-helix transcriptional regulator [Planctomycetota bacterium]